MDKGEIKKAFESLLQYGWMWGRPKHISRENWDLLFRYYKEELNSGKGFEPNRKERAN